MRLSSPVSNFVSQSVSQDVSQSVSDPFTGLRYGVWFDGVNDDVSLGNDAAFNYTTDLDFTITFVCSDPSVTQTLISKGEGASGTCWAVDIKAGELRFFGYTSGSVTKGVLSGGPTIVADTLYTARFTFDGTTWKIFVDGVEAVSTSSAGTLRTNTEDVYVGSRGGVLRFFDGVIRDVDVKIDGALIGQWNGYGNTDADWEDQGTGDVGMWFDGTDDKALFDGSPFNTKTKGRITGSFQTTGSGINTIVSFTDASDTASGMSVTVNAGQFQFFIRQGSQVLNAKTVDDTFDDGLQHTFDVTVTASGNVIKVDGATQSIAYAAGDASTVAWLDDVNDVDTLAIGVRPEATPEWFLTSGVARDITLYDEDGTTPLWSVNGYGNTDADWTDKVGSNDGTVSGSPSRAVSTPTGWRDANDGTVAGSPSRAISEDGGTTWAMETVSDTDAAAYIALLMGDGVNVPPATQTAINDFYVSGKDEGWYSELKRMYLPIWGAAGPNARCLVSGTSGTWVGSFTHASGYAHPTAASGSNRFETNYHLLDDDLTTEDACLMALAYDSTAPQDRGIPTSNDTIIGSGNLTADSIRINSLSSGITPQAAWLGAAESNGNIGSHGVMLANRKDGDTTLTRRDASGISDTSTTASLTGTYSDYVITGFGSARSSSGYTDQVTDAKAGAFGISHGLDSDERDSYTLAVKTLWEATSGLTL